MPRGAPRRQGYGHGAHTPVVALWCLALVIPSSLPFGYLQMESNRHPLFPYLSRYAQFVNFANGLGILVLRIYMRTIK
jgi:hypothetical protein